MEKLFETTCDRAYYFQDDCIWLRERGEPLRKIDGDEPAIMQFIELMPDEFAAGIGDYINYLVREDDRRQRSRKFMAEVIALLPSPSKRRRRGKPISSDPSPSEAPSSQPRNT